MIIKPSSALRNKYGEISQLVRDSREPVYITNNGESDIVIMSVDAYEKREEMLEMRAKVIEAEESRLSGAKTISLEDAREELDRRLEVTREL